MSVCDACPARRPSKSEACLLLAVVIGAALLGWFLGGVTPRQDARAEIADLRARIERVETDVHVLQEIGYRQGAGK